MSGSGGLSPAEQHLGDRLAALVDGELGHDSRDRVLSHLATCRRCKAEADAQRQLKNVFSATAPPPPSDGFLARLQGLPELDEDDDLGNPFRKGGGSAGGSAELFGQGFRIHEVGRAAPASASRGRRFAFAAAGAVSLAAFALGGTLPMEAAVDAGPGGAPAVTPGRGGAQDVDVRRQDERSTVRPAIQPYGAPLQPAGDLLYTPLLPVASTMESPAPALSGPPPNPR